jgi:phenylalanyl-tRNA synthetase beta chain
VQTEPNPWWRPGRAARLQLGPKTVVAEFGALHPRVLKALDVSGPLFGFELMLETLPETKRRLKARAPLDLSPLMPLTRDFAFIVDKARPAGEVIRAVQGADKTLIASVHVFDVYQGERVGEGEKSVALQVTIQPKERTLTDEEIEALSGRIVSAAQKACGARLRR